MHLLQKAARLVRFDGRLNLTILRKKQALLVPTGKRMIQEVYLKNLKDIHKNMET